MHVWGVLSRVLVFEGSVFVDQITYIAIPVPPGTFEAKFFARVEVAAGYHPALLLRRDGLPTTLVYDQKFTLHPHAETITLVDYSPQVGTVYLGIWGGELLYSYHYFAGTPVEMFYLVKADVISCENAFACSSSDNCMQTVADIPLNLSDSLTPTCSRTVPLVNTSGSNKFVGKVLVPALTQQLVVDVYTTLEPFNLTRECGDELRNSSVQSLTMGLLMHVSASLFYDGSMSVSSNSTQSDHIVFDTSTLSSGMLIVQENLTTYLDLNVLNPVRGLWTVRVETDLQLRSGNRTINLQCGEFNVQACAGVGACAGDRVGLNNTVRADTTVKTQSITPGSMQATNISHDSKNLTCTNTLSVASTRKTSTNPLDVYYETGYASLGQTITAENFTRLAPNNMSEYIETMYTDSHPSKIFVFKLADAPMGSFLSVRLDVKLADGVSSMLAPVPLSILIRCGGLPLPINDGLHQARYGLGSNDYVLETSNADSSTAQSDNSYSYYFYIERPKFRVGYDSEGTCYSEVQPVVSESLYDGWAIEARVILEFDSCSGKDFCPQSRGSCANVDGYATAAVCVCRYPYGGENCSSRTISHWFYTLQILCLVVSNLAMGPAIYLCVQRRMLSLTAVLCTPPVFSIIYHLCDIQYVCVLDFYHLAVLDRYSSLMSVCLIILYFANASVDVFWAVGTFVSPLAILAVSEGDGQGIAVVLAILCVSTCVSIRVGLLWHHAASRYDPRIGHNDSMLEHDDDDNDDDIRLKDTYRVRLSKSAYNCATSGNVTWKIFLVGICLSAAGATCFALQSRTNYWFVHSMWHLCIMGAVYPLVLSRTPQPYVVFTYSRGSYQVVDWMPHQGHLSDV